MKLPGSDGDPQDPPRAGRRLHRRAASGHRDPLTAAAVVDVLDGAGAPSGVVNYDSSSDAVRTVWETVHHPATQKLSSTGSTEVGRLVLHEAADRVVSTSTELGGNAAFLVLASADVDAAVDGAMAAKMRNGAVHGQPPTASTCTWRSPAPSQLC